MATISIDLNGETTTFSLSDTDANRILVHYSAVHPGSQSEVVTFIAELCVDMLAQSTLQAEKQNAAIVAADAVPPLDITLT